MYMWLSHYLKNIYWHPKPSNNSKAGPMWSIMRTQLPHCGVITRYCTHSNFSQPCNSKSTSALELAEINFSICVCYIVVNHSEVMSVFTNFLSIPSADIKYLSIRQPYHVWCYSSPHEFKLTLPLEAKLSWVLAVLTVNAIQAYISSYLAVVPSRNLIHVWNWVFYIAKCWEGPVFSSYICQKWLYKSPTLLMEWAGSGFWLWPMGQDPATFDTLALKTNRLPRPLINFAFLLLQVQNIPQCILFLEKGSEMNLMTLDPLINYLMNRITLSLLSEALYGWVYPNWGRGTVCAGHTCF